MSRILRKVIRKLEPKIFATWIEIEAAFSKRTYAIIDKNIIICQGSGEDPSLVYINKNEIDELIETLQKIKEEL